MYFDATLSSTKTQKHYLTLKLKKSGYHILFRNYMNHNVDDGRWVISTILAEINRGARWESNFQRAICR